MTPQRFLLFAAACIIAPALSALDSRTVWDGAYTDAQAKRGQAVYTAECSQCHREDLSGYNGVLIGNRFMNDWREDTVDHFFDLVKKTMPRNAPSSLSDSQYLDIVAYVLQANAFPAGAKELTLDALGSVRVEAKQGPEPVPDFALVEVVACLVQDAGGNWKLTNATEPVRTRNPNASTPEELKALVPRSLGTAKFSVLDMSTVGDHPPKDYKVDAKGLLIRKPGDDRLNLTSLQPVASTCAP